VLHAAAIAAQADPAAWPGMAAVHGDRGNDPVFAQAFAEAAVPLGVTDSGADLASRFGRAPSAAPRLITVDCDGVLADSEPISVDVLRETVAAAGGARLLGRS
jgi:hypothetical protein